MAGVRVPLGVHQPLLTMEALLQALAFRTKAALRRPMQPQRLPQLQLWLQVQQQLALELARHLGKVASTPSPHLQAPHQQGDPHPPTPLLPATPLAPHQHLHTQGTHPPQEPSTQLQEQEQGALVVQQGCQGVWLHTTHSVGWALPGAKDHHRGHPPGGYPSVRHRTLWSTWGLTCLASHSRRLHLPSGTSSTRGDHCCRSLLSLVHPRMAVLAEGTVGLL
jgi:hypothetical protein